MFEKKLHELDREIRFLEKVLEVFEELAFEQLHLDLEDPERQAIILGNLRLSPDAFRDEELKIWTREKLREGFGLKSEIFFDWEKHFPGEEINAPALVSPISYQSFKKVLTERTLEHWLYSGLDKWIIDLELVNSPHLGEVKRVAHELVSTFVVLGELKNEKMIGRRDEMDALLEQFLEQVGETFRDVEIR